MSNKVVVLDGTRIGDPDPVPLHLLTETLEQSGADVRVFALREMRLAHCIGDFACWLETPGVCRYHEPASTIVEAVSRSDTTVLVTPITFGGYSSQLKQLVDRWASLCLPYVRAEHGEIHHVARYRHFPRLVALGVQARPDAQEATLFKLLVGRNAINFHAPSYAAEVFGFGDDPARFPDRLQSVLARHDPLPWARAIRPLMPPPEPAPSLAGSAGSKQALLVVGSPKTLSRSTSSVLGTYLLERLQKEGWETESVTIRPTSLREPGRAELLATVDRADLLLFAFPLYIDALPYLMTRALEVIAEHRRSGPARRAQALVAIANNGFAESYQNHLALSMCRQFAAAAGMRWLGGLAMGAGEAISGGEPLQPKSSFGVPCQHVLEALDVTAAALARGSGVPDAAIRGIARSPIPVVPFAVWRWLFVRGAVAMWEGRAASHGVDKHAIRAQPFEVSVGPRELAAAQLLVGRRGPS